MTVKDINVPDKNVGELISRQAALDEIDKNRQALLSLGMDGAEHILCHYGRPVIEDLPTIDAVPVTRCRDCKHRKAKMGAPYGNGLVLCKDGVWRDMAFFCADGERSEE